MLAVPSRSKRVHVACNRSDPITFLLHAVGECVTGVKHTGETPAGRGPAASQFLSSNGASPENSNGVGSWFQVIVPSPG